MSEKKTFKKWAYLDFRENPDLSTYNAMEELFEVIENVPEEIRNSRRRITYSEYEDFLCKYWEKPKKPFILRPGHA